MNYTSCHGKNREVYKNVIAIVYKKYVVRYTAAKLHNDIFDNLLNRNICLASKSILFDIQE